MPGFYIVAKGEQWPQSYRDDFAAAQSHLATLKFEEPGKFEGAEIVDCDEFINRHENEYMGRPVAEIDAATFDEMLNVLPPLAWCHAGGVERFNMSEFTSGRVTSQFARMDDRYFRKYVRHGDATTYMTRDTICAAFATIAPQNPQ